MPLLGLLVFFNGMAFALMGIDKHLAKKGAFRIPEHTLFIPIFLFGALGGYLGMKAFRHKTKTPMFVFGIPLAGIVELALCVAALLYFH